MSSVDLRDGSVSRAAARRRNDDLPPEYDRARLKGAAAFLFLAAALTVAAQQSATGIPGSGC